MLKISYLTIQRRILETYGLIVERRDVNEENFSLIF